MKKSIHFGVFAVLGVLLMFTGCASKKQTTKQFNALQQQVGTLNDQLSRLDQSLQETRSAIQSEQNRVAELESQLRSGGRGSSFRDSGAVMQGIYRTPSGFELPSLHIQQALKNAGYYKGALDGKIGAGTREAIKSFQGDNGMDPDGVVGRQTWTKLKSYL